MDGLSDFAENGHISTKRLGGVVLWYTAMSNPFN